MHSIEEEENQIYGVKPQPSLFKRCDKYMEVDAFAFFSSWITDLTGWLLRQQDAMPRSGFGVF